MKKRLAYVDQKIHIKTSSTQFLIDILKKHYNVSCYWSDLWDNGLYRKIAQEKYDVVVLFQNFNYGKSILNSLNCRNIVIVPMFDAIAHEDDLFWLPYRDRKFLNFSLTLHNRLAHLGITTFYSQYFKPPEEYTKAFDFTALRGFFWQRRNDITFKQIKSLISKSEFEHIHLHLAVDYPKCRKVIPSAEDNKRYGITISEWFGRKEDYFKVLKRANVYFVPRSVEGIGMSFLEAMSRGQCVVAPNCPTMNEYVQHGVNGFLYDLRNPEPLDFCHAKEMGRTARLTVESGYKRWIDSESRLIDFIGSERKPLKVNASEVSFGASSFREKGGLAFRNLSRTIKNAILTHFPLLYRDLVKARTAVGDFFTAKRGD